MPAIASCASAADATARPRAAIRAVPEAGWVVAAFVLALGVFWIRQWQIAATLGWSSFPLDDSWIHLQFARNLAEGHGFAYNPGIPVAGSTAPLWTLLLAAVFAVLGSHPLWAKLVGMLATLGTALLAQRLVWRLTAHRGPGLIAGVSTATAGPLVWGALSGMEVSLAALLVTAALLCQWNGREAATAALLALAALTRPEATLLVPLCWLARPISWRRTALYWGALTICLTPWVLFNQATSGSPLPATASAKVQGGLIGLLSGLREPLATTMLRPLRFEAEWVGWLWATNVLLPLLILPGLAVLGYRHGRWVIPATVLILHPVGMALLAPAGGPAFQEGRYSIHLLPLAIAVAAIGLDVLAGARRLRPAALALFLVASVVAVLPAASRYAWAVQNIDAMQVRLGHWVLAHTPAQARLALNDIGAIAYISRREVVDVIGLVTPAILPYRHRGEAGVLRYLERACPDYLIIFPAWLPTLSSMSDRFPAVHRVRLDHNTVAGADEMVVYETPWNRWRHPVQPCPDAGQDGRR
ncbi:MAG TPA: hypothetical protein VGT40_10635 [Methylomirabilota bacterium]|jgi:hypothetical protein|nr:hypothetical protein [Methylomirabilota bacterium]